MGYNILKEKIDLVLALNDVAWKRSSALVQVIVAYGEAEQEIYVMNFKGIYVKEFRPRTRVVSKAWLKKMAYYKEAMMQWGTRYFFLA